jgi:two-component system sensor histidine kinase YesM
VHRWGIIHDGDTYYLVRLEQVSDSDVYIGALIQAAKLIDELPTAGSANPELEELLVSGDGIPLTETSLTVGDVAKIESSLKEPGNEAYRKFKRSSDGRRYLAVSADFDQAPIHMMAIVPEKTLLKQLFYFQWAIYLIPVVGLVVILIYSFFLKRTLLRPMQALISGMRRIKYGDLGVRLPEESSFEFDFLADTFNSMAGQISRLKIDVYEEMLKKQEAEFKHLQAQINPHFYLNSLNIIYSLSALRKNDLVEKMTEHLADYFRFITRAHREFITLAEEIDHIANYLEIQKLRFPDKLVFRIDLPERYAGCALPPLTVQSFVENAVIHGMPEGERLYVISIAVGTSPSGSGDCEIVIADNGRGLAPEKLRMLQAGNESPTAGQGAGGLGIWNVRRRLGMVYGNRADIRFSDGEPSGTVVRIRIPIEGEHEGGESDV